MTNLRAAGALLGSGLTAAACNPSNVASEAGTAAPSPTMGTSDAGEDTLASLFRDGSPEDVAAALEAMVEAQAGDAADAVADAPADSPDGKAAAKKQPWSPPRGKNSSNTRPIYKGISV